jgi:DtxR family Mn-dependent transcriptional regulator
MLERLETEGLIRRSGRQVLLTGAGLEMAERVVRRHRLAERLLVDVIGLDWDKAHLEAGRWEHVISDEVEERLVELLGNPTTCPHGNPIPGSGAGNDPRQRCLSEVEAGERVRLARITEEVEIDTPSLSYLASHRLVPGAMATVQARAPDGTLTLDVDGEAVALGASMCSRLFVTSEPEHERVLR